MTKKEIQESNSQMTKEIQENNSHMIGIVTLLFADKTTFMTKKEIQFKRMNWQYEVDWIGYEGFVIFVIDLEL
jgi:hypothetical protein